MEPARKFKIIINSKECGTCSGPTPSEVAKKVVKKLCGSSSKVVKFSLKECKRGCERECGPYQGKMEKLDRPCKRDGKKITHRVVCGKVKKMRGGFWKLVAEDFGKVDGVQQFRIDTIGGKPHIFFGGKYNEPFKFVVFNIELVALIEKKSIGISVLEKTAVKPIQKLKNNYLELQEINLNQNSELQYEVKPIQNLENLSLELQYELSRLKEFLKNERKYETIRKFLEKYNLLQNIKEQTFSQIQDTYIEYSEKYKISYNSSTVLFKAANYSMLFFGFYESTPTFCLVFTENDFIIIDLKLKEDKYKDIISIEALLVADHFYKYIYLLENNENVPEFIKKKINELIEKEKIIRKKIIEHFSRLDLKKIGSNTDSLIKELKKDFPQIHNQNIIYKIINQEEIFIEKQIKKSEEAHMKNDINKKINDVYKYPIDEQNEYERYLNEGKRLAKARKADEAIRKAEEATRNAERNAERTAERKAERKAEEAERKAEEAERKAVINARRKAEAEIEEEAKFMNKFTKNLRKEQKYIKNGKNKRMVKNFIEEYYSNDNNFMSKLLMWYCSELSKIYIILSYSFKRGSINQTEFNEKLKEYLTAERLYKSESFPKKIDLEYRNQYEELKAFASFFIDTLNNHMKNNCIMYYNIISKLKAPLKIGNKRLFAELNDIIITALKTELEIEYINDLQIPVSTGNGQQATGNGQQQQQRATGNNNSNRQQQQATGNNNSNGQQATTTGNNNRQQQRNNNE